VFNDRVSRYFVAFPFAPQKVHVSCERAVSRENNNKEHLHLPTVKAKQKCTHSDGMNVGSMSQGVLWAKFKLKFKFLHKQQTT
jgi:hypothetical protein